MRNKESHLGHIHAGVTAQWTDSCEVVGSQQGGDDSILVDLSDHGGINKIHKPILVHRNAWRGKHTGMCVFDRRMVCGGDEGCPILGMMCLDEGPYWDG